MLGWSGLNDMLNLSGIWSANSLGLFVDGARLPVYLATQWRDLVAVWPIILVATAAVVVGTAVGTRVLGHLQQTTFRRVIGALLVVLGAYMAIGGRR